LDGAELLLEDSPKRLELCAEAAGARDKDSAATVADETRADMNLFIAIKLTSTASLCPVNVQVLEKSCVNGWFQNDKSRRKWAKGVSAGGNSQQREPESRCWNIRE